MREEGRKEREGKQRGDGLVRWGGEGLRRLRAAAPMARFSEETGGGRGATAGPDPPAT